MNEKQRYKPSVEARIAKALAANGSANHAQLVELWDEAADKIDELTATIAAEEPKLLDLENEEPEKSQQIIQSNKLRIKRLTKAIAELRPRVEALDREATANKWLEEAVKLQADADILREQLCDTYIVLCTQTVETWLQVDANARAIQRHRERRPSGVHYSLIDADNPRLRNKLRLPLWYEPDRLLFPKDENQEMQAAMANITPVATFVPAYASMEEREQAERAKYEAEAKAEDQRKRDEYYKGFAALERQKPFGCKIDLKSNLETSMAFTFDARDLFANQVPYVEPDIVTPIVTSTVRTMVFASMMRFAQQHARGRVVVAGFANRSPSVRQCSVVEP